MRNTLREFLKLSRQSPRSRACTDFGSLLAYTRWRSLSPRSIQPVTCQEARVHSLALVITAVAKVSCMHGLWLVARVNQKAGMPHDTPYRNILPSVCCFVTNISPYFLLFLFFITRGFSFLSKKTNLLSLPPSAILFLSIFVIFFIYRKAYNL